MRLIVITPEKPVAAEAAAIMTMLDHGVERVHLRHPGMSADDVSAIIEKIDTQYHHRLSLNDFHELAARYGCGIHLNRRNPVPPENFSGLTSRSCHSIKEAAEAAVGTAYRFISPVFDSISKHGYTAAFTDSELRRAFTDGSLDADTFALGGISCGNIPLLRDIGFSGVAVLGAAWGDGTHEDISKRTRHLLQCCNS